MANEHFPCDVNRGFLRRFDGNEKALYLDIGDSMITGKGIIFLESKRNEYTGDINYEFKSVKRVERSTYEGLDALIIYVRTNSLYGAEKIQIRLPGIQNISAALNAIEEIIEANAPAPKVVPTPAAAAAPTPAPAPAAPAPTPVAPAPAPAPTPVSTPTMASVTPPPIPASTPIPTIVRPSLDPSLMPASASMAAAPVTPAPAPMPAAPAPAPVAPAPAPAPVSTAPSAQSLEDFKKKLEKLEAIYQTGMITDKEYKTTKAEYVSVLNGLDSFFNKVKVNLQYSEVGFLSADEFDAFKKSTIEECSDLINVSNDILRQNLKKLLILNLFDIMDDAEYEKICTSITRSVQYMSDDPEDIIVEKVERWPILKECEIISDAQFEQFVKQVADDTKIRSTDTIPVLEHKLSRLTTLSHTFLFTPQEFAVRKQELVAELTTLDFSSDSKLTTQIACIVTLKKCEWITDMEYQQKKNEILASVTANPDIVSRLHSLRTFTDIAFISEEEYKAHEKTVIDDIFQQYSDISELQQKAQNLMRLKEANIISEADFNDYKKKLLSLA